MPKVGPELTVKRVTETYRIVYVKEKTHVLSPN